MNQNIFLSNRYLVFLEYYFFLYEELVIVFSTGCNRDGREILSVNEGKQSGAYILVTSFSFTQLSRTKVHVMKVKSSQNELGHH